MEAKKVENDRDAVGLPILYLLYILYLPSLPL